MLRQKEKMPLCSRGSGDAATGRSIRSEGEKKKDRRRSRTKGIRIDRQAIRIRGDKFQGGQQMGKLGGGQRKKPKCRREDGSFKFPGGWWEWD